MTPEERRPSAEKYRESLSPEMQEYWDSATDRKVYQVPEKPVGKTEEDERLTNQTKGLLTLMLLYWLYRCYDSFASTKPGDELSFFIQLFIFWLPIAAYFTWGIIQGDL